MADNSPLSQTKDAHMRPQLPSNLLFLPSARQDAPTKATDPTGLHPSASEQGATFLQVKAEAEPEDRVAKAFGEPHAPARPKNSQLLPRAPSSLLDSSVTRCKTKNLTHFRPHTFEDCGKQFEQASEEREGGECEDFCKSVTRYYKKKRLLAADGRVCLRELL